MIDAHIHLDQYPPDELPERIAEWRRGGIEGVIAVSTDLASSYRTLEWKRRYPDFVYAAVGYHPEQPIATRRERDELLVLLKTERHLIHAVGEVGLPHYRLAAWGDPPLAPYLDALAEFAEAARRLELPLLLHAVHDKAGLALEVVKRQGVAKAHFHWLKAPGDVVAEIVAARCYVSVTPEACYRERDANLARRIPLDLLLLETDGPWPFAGPFAGRPTTPLFLRETSRHVARLHGVTPQHLAERCRANALRLLGVGAEG